MAPGKPVTPDCSLSWRSPASRFDSPSRSRSLVVTSRLPNDGIFTPPMTTSALRVLLMTVKSRRMSPSSVTIGVISTLTPTS